MAFNYNKLTLKSQEALQTAQEIASNYSNQIIEPVHLFAALLQDKEGLITSVIHKLGTNKDLIQIKIGEMLERIPKVTGSSVGNQSLSVELSQVLENAFKEANQMKDEYISVEHILLGISELKNSELNDVLKSYDLTKENILKVLKDVRGSGRITG